MRQVEVNNTEVIFYILYILVIAYELVEKKK